MDWLDLLNRDRAHVQLLLRRDLHRDEPVQMLQLLDWLVLLYLPNWQNLCIGVKV
eukprot:m.95780 g.95780  ORF g.95780 m.95780 type:complete len:55 (-) comp13909_c0_seq1:25-189(-)